MESEVLSAQARQALADIDTFLKSKATVVVSTAAEKEAAVALGNEIQKRWKELDALRAQEKKPHDDKGKEVQAKFVPKLNLLLNRKDELSRSVTAFNYKVQLEREAEQRRITEATDAEIARIDKAAESAEEKVKQYTAKAIEAEADFDVDAAARYWAMVNKWSQKKDEIKQAAAVYVAPTVLAAPKAAGERKIVEYIIEVTSLAELVQHCVKTNQFHYLQMNDAEVKALAKRDKEAVLPGVKIQRNERTSFSGK